MLRIAKHHVLPVLRMTSRGHEVTLWPHTGTAHAPDTAELVTENISDVSATVRPLFDFVVVYDGSRLLTGRGEVCYLRLPCWL